MFTHCLIILLLTLGKSYSQCESEENSISCLLLKCFQNLDDCFEGITINGKTCVKSSPSITTLPAKNVTSESQTLRMCICVYRLFIMYCRRKLVRYE